MILNQKEVTSIKEPLTIIMFLHKAISMNKK